MSNPTTEQSDVLDAQDRVRIVRAAPGCGKTWLVAEAIRRALGTWTGPGGIAALSFTNVGGNEIRSAVGHDLSHPHFVGTLDSFIYRFIVRQFAHILNPQLRCARLIPADQANAVKHDKRAKVILPDYDPKRPVCLFDVSFTGGIRNQATLILRKWSRAIPLSRNDCAVAHRAKHRLWTDDHWMSHSDVTYIACAILRDSAHGHRIRSWIVSRFPLLVVDELQDTGWYLGEVLHDLLDISEANGLLVGDPDQAIYEFNGARPELFDTFGTINGSREFSVRKSLRCPLAITSVANHLRFGQHEVFPREGDRGKALLLVSDAIPDALDALRTALAAKKGGGINCVLARTNEAVDQIGGGKLASALQFSSRPLALAHQAIRYLNTGQSRKAIEAARAAISYVLMGQVCCTDEVLHDHNIDHHQLRLAAAQLLESGNLRDASESAWAWSERVKKMILIRIQSSGWTCSNGTAPSIKTAPKQLQNTPIARSLSRPPVPTTQAAHTPVRTVHGVKGETHDVTVFFVPPASRGRPCVSETWWSDDPKHHEERRIAFVAITRSRQEFILCVSSATEENLRNRRPDFHNCFEVSSIEDYLSSAQFKPSENPEADLSAKCEPVTAGTPMLA